MDIPTTRYAETPDGVHIAYQVFGNGPYDLLILDGWLSNVDAGWDLPHRPEFLRRFAERARVTIFDRRGVGGSDRPAMPETLAIEKSMQDALTVMDTVGAKRPVVYAIEDGCALGVLLSASYPERVSGLVLVSPTVRYWRDEEFPWGWSREQAAEWDRWIADEWGSEELWRRNLRALNISADEALVRAVAKFSRLCASPQTALAIDRTQREIDVRTLLPSVQAPTIVLTNVGDLRDPETGAGPWVAQQIPGARFIELPGDAHLPEFEDTGPLFRAFDTFVASIRREEATFERVLATVLFTDIVGSTERASELGDAAWRELLERHHSIVRAMLGRYRGNEVDTAGDGFFATFDGPARAVRCAEATVDAVRSIGLQIRAGVHTGEVGTIDGKVGGLGVVIGARVGALAGASEVLVSQTVKDLVAGSGLAFEDAGEHELKGVPDRWRVWRAVSDQTRGASDAGLVTPG